MILVFHFIDKITPEIGGPYSSIKCLINNTTSTNINHFVFVNMKIDKYDEEISSFNIFSINKLKKIYFQYKNNKSYTNKIIFHIHGLWSICNLRASFFAKKFKVPVMVSIRGMLNPLALKKRNFKKKFAFAIYQRWILKNAAILHVTSKQEELVLKNLKFINTLLIPNIIDINQNSKYKTYEKKDNQIKNFLYIGRIDPIKAIDNLIIAWKLLPKHYFQLNKLNIVGNISDKNYYDKIILLAGGINNKYSIKFHGPKYKKEKHEILCESNYLILPSHTENFGNSILEGLFYGIPVIASKGTPWENIECNGAGWYVLNDPQSLKKVIISAIEIDNCNYNKMAQAAKLLSNNYLPDKIKVIYIRNYIYLSNLI